MLRTGIETRLTLRQSDILPRTFRPFQRKRNNFTHTFIYLHICLLATGELNSWKELCICIYAYVVAGNSSSSLSGYSIWRVWEKVEENLNGINCANFKIWVLKYCLKIYISVIQRLIITPKISQQFALTLKQIFQVFSFFFFFLLLFLFQILKRTFILPILVLYAHFEKSKFLSFSFFR